MSEQTPSGGYVAAIDLGSNSFHMIVARVDDGHLQVVDRLRESVRLAAGLGEKNRLDGDAKQRAIDCLARFGQRLREFPIGSVRAVGTNTLRKARGSGDFLEQASEALGHPIEVIAGSEEARLIYLGVSHGQALVDGNRLVVDIGGGSTELIVGRGFEPLLKESLYMGCVSASKHHFRDGQITKQAFSEAKLAARQELRAIQRSYRRKGWIEAVGASGTIKAVAAVIREQGWSDSGITLPALKKMTKVMLSAGHVDKLRLNGLNDERRPVLPGGVAVLTAIFESLKIESMQASDWALREGVVYDMAGRIRHEDVRTRTIDALSRRYRVDRRQAKRVTTTALTILDQIGEAWELTGDCGRCLIEWAAGLHELGLAIAHGGYHKHGAYLLAHSDMPGFALEEQARLAVLVRSHRRKFPVDEFRVFPKRQRRSLQRLAIIQRLAAILHRGRSPRTVPPVTVDATGEGLVLRFSRRWLERHPLTRADLRNEAGYLAQLGYTLEVVREG